MVLVLAIDLTDLVDSKEFSFLILFEPCVYLVELSVVLELVITTPVLVVPPKIQFQIKYVGQKE